MSQDNSFIITKSKDLKIPKEIPHFIVSDDIYFPICDTNGSEFNEFISLVLTNKKYDIKDYYSNKFDFIELTKKLNINSFVAYHYSEFGMMTLNICEFSVVNNIVIKESIVCPEERIIEPENYSEFENELEKNSPEILLNIKVDSFFIEQLKDFDIAESLYKKWGCSLNFSEIDKINSQKIEENRKRRIETESQLQEDNINNGITEKSNFSKHSKDEKNKSFWETIKEIFSK